MNQNEFNQLTDKVNQGRASDDELHLFTAYLNQITSADDSWDSSNLGAESEVKQELLNRIESKIGIQKRLQIWPRIAAAASIIFCIGLGYYFYQTRSRGQFNHQIAHTDIRPGSNKATLTLGDGSKIILNEARNGALASQGNTNVIKTANGQIIYNKVRSAISKETLLYNTMATPRGGQYQLTLPDGTQVWLNAASSITFPTRFDGSERRVTITGEAYFEVAKNKHLPFYVQSGDQTVRVLGTHFNINAYPDEDEITTTLLEGSVKVSGKDRSAINLIRETIIKPGEQATLNKAGFNIETVDTEDVVAWKNGITSFKNADIKSIMRQLCRWYDVDVQYDPNISKRLFTGEIARNASLSDVFRILELSKIKFKVKGRTVIVSP